MLQEVLSVILKETWELKRSKKAFLLVLVGASVPTGALYFAKDGNNIFPIPVLLWAYPLFIAYFASMQFLIYSIIDEKKQKTLEMLISLDLRRVSIILGKVVPVSIIAYFASMFLLLQLTALTKLDPYYMQFQFSVSLPMFIWPIFLAFIGSNICILITLLFPDEKAVFSYFALSTAGMVYLFYTIFRNIILTNIHIVLLLGSFSLIVVLLNSYILSKRTEIAIK